MIKQRSQILTFWFACWDLALAAAAWVGAYYVRFDSGWLPVTKATPEFALCLSNLPLVLVLAFVAFRLTGMYDVHRLGQFVNAVASVVKGSVLLSVLVMATTFYMHNPYESRGVMVIFTALLVSLLLGLRRASWVALQWLRSRGYNQTFALVVGTGKVARATARSLRRTTWLGIKPLGYVEDNVTGWSGDLDILGGTADLPALIRKYRVAYVFLCLPLDRYQEIRRIYDRLSQEFVEVHVVANASGLAGLSLNVAPLDDMTMIGLRESPHHGVNVAVKRVMDIAVSLAALALLAPLMLAIGVLVKLTSRGPVFYAQERCGLGGKPFRMLKFRSMKVDAEAETGAIWARQDDPRRTAFGAFLRKTSLDELPQLINVLRGDMSVVGPRPERPEFIQKFRKTIPNYMARHSVKCGITGWAQAHGWRGNTSLRKRIQYDLYYINHWTPWLDVRILWLTVAHTLSGRNAH